MTNEPKTEAPDHLWLDTFSKSDKGPNWPTKPAWAATQYTRTDLAQAAAGAAVRACAEAIDDPDFTQEDVNYVDNGHKWVLLEEAQTAILALEPEAQQALDKLLGERDAEIVRLKEFVERLLVHGPSDQLRSSYSEYNQSTKRAALEGRDDG